MAAPLVHTIFPSTFDPLGTNLTLNQLNNVEVNPGVDMLVAMAGGTVDPVLIADAFQEPSVKFMSRDLKTILTSVSPIAGLAVTTAATMQFQRRLSGGTFVSGSGHYSLTSTGGLIVIEEFGAEQDSRDGADMTLVYHPVWDGSTLPLVVNAAVALSGTPGAGAVHTLGKVTFQGAALDGVRRVRVRTGIKVRLVRHSGELYPRVVFITDRRPVIEIDCLNLASTMGAAVPGVGISALTSSCICYFRHVTAGGGRVADATATHVSVTAPAGAVKMEQISGGQEDDVMTRITINVVGLLTYSAATAIA